MNVWEGGKKKLRMPGNLWNLYSWLRDMTGENLIKVLGKCHGASHVANIIEAVATQWGYQSGRLRTSQVSECFCWQYFGRCVTIYKGIPLVIKRHMKICSSIFAKLLGTKHILPKIKCSQICSLIFAKLLVHSTQLLFLNSNFHPELIKL